jgi:hypothetical protein
MAFNMFYKKLFFGSDALLFFLEMLLLLNVHLNCVLLSRQADEMAKTFRQRVAQAEAAARAEELRLQQGV